MSFILYCLGVFFVYYVFNCSDIAEPVRDWLKPRLNENVLYAIECALCTTWWVSLAAWFVSLIPLSYVFAAPVVNLFLIKTLNALNHD